MRGAGPDDDRAGESPASSGALTVASPEEFPDRVVRRKMGPDAAECRVSLCAPTRAPMPKTLLHLIRHGESAGNVDPTLPRRDDPPLTARGEAQATTAAAEIARRGVGAIFSSPVRRARETAGRVAAAVGLPVTLVPGLGEVDMGSLADPTAPAERAERDAIFAAWLAGDRRRAFPGGEDFPAVLRRVSEALEGACARGGAVAVVTHRMAIAAALSLCAPIDQARPAPPCANGSITTLRRDDDGRWTHLAAGEDGPRG